MSLKAYLRDPILHQMYQQIRERGPLKSISLDLTHRCNIRCKGCYYFEEDMDKYPSEGNDVFEQFILSEKTRGTNFITIVGGEPSMALGRLRKLYLHFKLSVATNGLKKIPNEGLENLPIGVAVWGDPDTDRYLRGNDKIDIFAKALRHYKNDERAFFYYTVTPGNVDQIEGVVRRCIDNGNRVLFNYYSDLAALGGTFDHRIGFEAVSIEINRMITRFPGKILMTPYFNKVIATGRLYDMDWGYEVCTNLSTNLQKNHARLANGFPYNPHFRAYYADFKTTRRCCTGECRDCSSCYDTWEHFSWVMVNLRKHLGSKEEFANWLTTMYLFYVINRLVDTHKGMQLITQFLSPNVVDIAQV